MVCARDASSMEVTLSSSKLSAGLSRKSKVDLSSVASSEFDDQEHAVAVGKLGVNAHAGGVLVAEEQSLRLLLALDVKGDIHARRRQPVRLQIRRVLVDDAILFECRQARDDVAEAVAVGRRLRSGGEIVHVPCGVLAKRRDLAACSI